MSVQPGRFHHLHPGRRVPPKKLAAVFDIQHRHPAAAFNGVFRHREERLGVRRLRGIVACLVRQEFRLPAVRTADDRIGAQRPAGIAHQLAPVEQAGGVAVARLGGVTAQQLEAPFPPVRADADPLVRLREPAAYGIDVVSHAGQAGVFRETARNGVHGGRRHERRAGRLVFRPGLLEGGGDLGEGVAERQPRGFADGLVPVQEGDAAVVGDAPVVARGQVRHVEMGPDAADSEVPGVVIVGGVPAHRSVAPAPVVAIIARGEAHAVVFEEIRRPAASCGRQGRLRGHGVPFEERGSAVEHGQRARRKLPAQHVQPAERFRGAVLHLYDVARLVDGELEGPGGGFRHKGVGDGQHFHAVRGPGHLAVGVRCVGVQDDGHLAAVGRVRPESGARAHAARDLFHRDGVHARERIQALRVNHPVGRGLDAAPAQTARVSTHRVELRPRRQRRQREPQDQCQGEYACLVDHYRKDTAIRRKKRAIRRKTVRTGGGVLHFCSRKL